MKGMRLEHDKRIRGVLKFSGGSKGRWLVGNAFLVGK